MIRTDSKRMGRPKRNTQDLGHPAYRILLLVMLACAMWLVGCNYRYTKTYLLPENMPSHQERSDSLALVNTLPESIGDWVGWVSVESVRNSNRMEAEFANSFGVSVAFHNPLTIDSANVGHWSPGCQDIQAPRVVVDSVQITCKPLNLRSVQQRVDCLQFDYGVIYYFKPIELSHDADTIILVFDATLVDSSGLPIVTKSFDLNLVRYEHRWNDVGGWLMGP